MLVANSFDLWQRDVFFSAAEEVQHSTDILESAYRTWLREKKEGLGSNDLEELRRKMQTALGTAKWQLEEFEKAVQINYGNCCDQTRVARHQQFVVAIESQISRVEDALRGSLREGGKQPLQWVNLDDEDERDDLATFLSGSHEMILESKRHESLKPCHSLEMNNLSKMKPLDYVDHHGNNSNMKAKIDMSSSNDAVIDIAPMNCFMDPFEREVLGTRVSSHCEVDQTSSLRGARYSPKCGTLSIEIPNGDYQNRMRSSTVEDTPKGKSVRTSNYLGLRGINLLFRGSSNFKVRMQSHRQLQLRLLIVLMISFFLLVPYFLHLS